MATLVFSALGTAVGGPLGGAIGALVGRQLDGAIFGSPTREGARLKDLAVTTSTYGSAVPRHFGRMRVGGTIIWATELAEHREVQGGGKGRPSVTNYNYSASFAVALSSRPLRSIGRIWADGNLLRGASGDLKVGGSLRFYSGYGDQDQDPLIAAAESPGPCPAYRDLAYVVFENLQLGEFGNRIPALTFEVIAEETIAATAVLEGLDLVDSAFAFSGISGMSAEGAFVDTLQQFASVRPLLCDVAGQRLRIDDGVGGTVADLPPAAVSVADEAFGGREGFGRKRAASPPAPLLALRYYDIGRDFQPGVQRACGRIGSGQPASIDLPCAMFADDARALVETATRRRDWGRQTLSWRTAQIDPRWRPGTRARVPGQAGVWQILDWEWRASGLDLTLARVPHDGAADSTSLRGDAGRASIAADQELGPTWIAAFEAPWDGTGSADLPVVRAAVSSAGDAWSGAALFVDQGDGDLVPLGPSGRTRAAVGDVLGTLGAASPLIADRSTFLEVRLLSPGMTLADASARQLSMGANSALVGSEFIQFSRATPSGGNVWRLEGLLRGRGGTEHQVDQHVTGERFVLIDSTLVSVDSRLAGTSPLSRVAAIGAGDSLPVTTSIACRGLTLRPLCPVHPRTTHLENGGLLLQWTRRARGSWEWRDEVETPLREESEAYEVLLGPLHAPHAAWRTAEQRLSISAEQLNELATAYPAASFMVRQVGAYRELDSSIAKINQLTVRIRHA